MNEPRTSCSVPFCRRSAAGRLSWWLCRDHYSAVPMRVKTQHRKVKAICRRRGWIDQDKRHWWTTSVRAQRIMDRAGRLVVRAAIEAATGA